MEENLIKCSIRTENGLIVSCELSNDTIKELKTKNLVSVHEFYLKNNR